MSGAEFADHALLSPAPTSTPPLARPRVLDEVANAIEAIVPRVCELVTSIDRPTAPAIGIWNAVETAVHLLQTIEADLAAVTGSFTDEQRALLEDPKQQSLDELTQRWVREEPERDPRRLARRITNAANALRAELARAVDDRPVTWLAGMQLPLSAVGAHVVEESLVHGRDIARAQRHRWPVLRSHAEVAVGFVFAVLDAMDPAGFVDAHAAAGFTAVYEFRVRGAKRIYLVFDDGTLEVQHAFNGPVDVHVSAHPAVFLLAFLNRINPLRHALTGRMIVWGRRPWLMARLPEL